MLFFGNKGEKSPRALQSKPLPVLTTKAKAATEAKLAIESVTKLLGKGSADLEQLENLDSNIKFIKWATESGFICMDDVRCIPSIHKNSWYWNVCREMKKARVPLDWIIPICLVSKSFEIRATVKEALQIDLITAEDQHLWRVRSRLIGIQEMLTEDYDLSGGPGSLAWLDKVMSNNGEIMAGMPSIEDVGSMIWKINQTIIARQKAREVLRQLRKMLNKPDVEKKSRQIGKFPTENLV